MSPARPAASAATGYRCLACGARRDWDQIHWLCPGCGGLLGLDPAAPFDPAAIDRDEPSLHRYRACWPAWPAVTLGEGWTPLQPAADLGDGLWLKLEYLSPTGSFKDRGATLQVARLAAGGGRRLVEDSSGNAGSALAVYARRAGLPSLICCPAETAPGKLALIRAAGAELVTTVDRPAASLAATDLATGEGCCYASHVLDPAYLLGTQTVAWELFEQLDGEPPAQVILPVGNGSLLLGLARGFAALVGAGLWPRPPRLVAVQGRGLAPLAADLDERQPLTLAEGIRIRQPARLAEMQAALAAGGGTVVTVDNAAIRQAARDLAGRGWLVEPTAAAALAGWRQLPPVAGISVVVLTGAGWKLGAQLPELLAGG